MIGYSIIKYTESTPFPGLSAMVPVLGTTLIIYSGMVGKSLIGKVIGISPLVFIGKISYSLYLWHWPLIIFAKYYLIRPMTSAELFIVFLVIWLSQLFPGVLLRPLFDPKTSCPPNRYMHLLQLRC